MIHPESHGRNYRLNGPITDTYRVPTINDAHNVASLSVIQVVLRDRIES